MDCDIIINHDLAELYNTDLTDKYLAAVKEIVYLGFLNNPQLNINNSVTDYTKIKLGMDNPYDYFNAGVLLLNLEMFRNNHTMDELLTAINENQFSIVEQDLLNSVADGKVQFLDYAWNFMSCLTEPAILDEAVSMSDTTIPNLRLAPEQEFTLYTQGSTHPYIYHYLTRMKPWKYPYLKYADIWWMHARKTVWYETFLCQLSQHQVKQLCDSSEKIQQLETALVEIQCRLGYFDDRSKARKLIDKIMPLGTRRREVVKKIAPRGSRRRNFLKKIYHFFFSEKSH